MKDNSNETLRFVRNSGLKRSDFEYPPALSRGDVIVFVLAVLAMVLLVVGVV